MQSIRVINNGSHWLAVFGLIIALPGCAQRHYDQTGIGTLKGELIVEWREPNQFVYRPNQNNPLRFVRPEGTDTIQPDRMWTDGGSIPRPFWVFKNFSPWGYGPAFVIHDWLFRMQDCQIDGYDAYTLEEAAVIMSEVMKTLMERDDFEYGSVQAMYAMHKAVQTAPARAAWTDGDCVPLPSLLVLSQPAGQRFTISFD